MTLYQLHASPSGGMSVTTATENVANFSSSPLGQKAFCAWLNSVHADTVIDEEGRLLVGTLDQITGA